MERAERARRTAGRAFLALTLGRWLRADVPYARQRKRVSRVGRAARVPRGTAVERVDLGGVPAERVVLGTPDPSRAIILCHAGGFTVGDARGHRPMAAHLSRAAAATVFTLDYHLAPEHPAPAAYEDLLAAYAALREQGYEPGSMAFAGDSAGGNMALIGAMRLRDTGDVMPAALFVMCPLADLGHSGDSVSFNAGHDYLNRGWGLANAAAFAPGRDLRDPAVSPLFGDLAGLPPIHLQSGGHDLSFSDAERLEERVRLAGGEIEHRREPEIWHDFQAMPDLSGAASKSIADGGAALRRVWERGSLATRAPGAVANGNAASNGHAVERRGPRVAIIGAGFGGVALALELRRKGVVDFTIFDRADGFGGTWRANSYPGAACDVPARAYSLAREPNFKWSRRYAPQREILAYLEEVADKHGLGAHLRPNTEIERADFDDARRVWKLQTTGGEIHEAEMLVTACGQLSRPFIPEIPGLERFEGKSFHSAEWNHDCGLAGRKVAVVGTGASSIQLVPEVAAQARQVEVFQRSAHYIFMRIDKAYGAIGNKLLRFGPWRKLARFGLWAPVEFFGTGFGKTQWPLWPLKVAARMNRRKLPAGPLRDAMTPVDEIGCKRVLLSSDFYPALTRPDVTVTTEAITEITPRGIRTADGAEHEADAIIWGTGFKSNDFLTPMRVFGADGTELNEAWRDGASAYLGVSIAGFPNLAMMYGPNTNLGSGSIIHMLESQAAYIAAMAQSLADDPGVVLDVRSEVAEQFDAEMQEKLGEAVWSTGCHNWYLDARGRNSNNWPGTSSAYRRRLRRFDPAAYAVSAPEAVPTAS